LQNHFSKVTVSIVFACWEFWVCSAWFTLYLIAVAHKEEASVSNVWCYSVMLKQRLNCQPCCTLVH